MDKSGFALLFRDAVRRALDEAGLSSTGGEPVVEFHGKFNPSAHQIGLEEAVDLLWLSPKRFYRIVDISAVLGAVIQPIIFVRPAGLEPCAYSETWDPNDLGPFKVMGPMLRGSTYLGPPART